MQREREALGSYLTGTYRDPAAAYAALGEVVKRDGWYQAGKEIARDPAQFGELRGNTGWLASAAAKEERAGAERASPCRTACGASMRRRRPHAGATCRACRRSRSRTPSRPGLSKPALDMLQDVRTARGMAEVQRDGESYDDRQRRREAAVAGAWHKGRADPHLGGELDRFYAAASQRLGEEGERAASRAASSGRRVELVGIGREHQQGVDELARHFMQVREG